MFDFYKKLINDLNINKTTHSNLTQTTCRQKLMETKNLISLKEASSILGFKTNTILLQYLKKGILNAHEIEGSKRKWINIDELLKVPQPLPMPPPNEYFEKLKVNERWKKIS
jgi:hypothetical protein